MKSELIKISKLKNNSGQVDGLPANPRFIKDDKYQLLKKSIQEDPDMMELREVIAYDNGDELIVIAGNMRLRACKELGYKEVPTKILPSDTDVEKLKRITIKDNAGFGEHDWDILGNEWSDEPLGDWGLDLPDDWLQQEAEVEEDEAPEVDESEPPKSKLGEVYQLGRHRVMCGSATSEDDLERLLDGLKPDMVFTDPPYGMNYSGRGENTSNKIMNDDIDPTVFYNVGSHIAERYVWGRVENYKHLNEEPRDTIIWKKNNFGMGRGYRGQYECCFYYGDFSGSDSDVWDFAKDSKYEHPTQKPVGLSVRAIKNSKPSIVIDYFAGSGSTLLGCEQANVTNLSMELDPKYVDVIRKRYWKYVNNNDEDGWEANTPAIGEK